MTSDPSRPRDDVGPVGEEVAKLLGALAGWAREHIVANDTLAQGIDGWIDSQDVGGSWSRCAAEPAGTPCAMCPLCRASVWLRQLNPEAREHFGAAASSLVKAAAILLAAPTQRDGVVERIVLDDEAWPD